MACTYINEAEFIEPVYYVISPVIIYFRSSK